MIALGNKGENKQAVNAAKNSYNNILNTLRSRGENFSYGGENMAWAANILRSLGVKETKCAEAAKMMMNETGLQTGLVIRKDFIHVYNYVDIPGQGRMYFDVWRNHPPSFDLKKVETDNEPIGQQLATPR